LRCLVSDVAYSSGTGCSDLSLQSFSNASVSLQQHCQRWAARAERDGTGRQQSRAEISGCFKRSGGKSQKPDSLRVEISH
jgi:hypothetical protein